MAYRLVRTFSVQARGRNQRDGLGWGLVRKVDISFGRSFSSRRAASSQRASARSSGWRRWWPPAKLAGAVCSRWAERLGIYRSICNLGTYVDSRLFDTSPGFVVNTLTFCVVMRLAYTVCCRVSRQRVGGLQSRVGETGGVGKDTDRRL